MAVITHLAVDEFSRGIQALAIGASQNLATGAVTATGAALSSGVQVVRLVADADCFIAIGPVGSVSAATSQTRLVAGVPEYFRVPAKGPDGQAVVNTGGSAVAARAVTGTGNLSITEMY